MFDLGFGEMLLVAVVALVVLGPERLPQVARSAGLWVGRIQRFIANVKNELNQQSGIAEFQAAKNSIEQSVSSVRQELGRQIKDVENGMRDTAQGILPDHTDTVSLPSAAETPYSGSLKPSDTAFEPAVPARTAALHRFSLHSRALQCKRRLRTQSPALLRARARRHTSRKHLS